MSTLIFAYGSLINPKSRAQTLTNSSVVAEQAALKNYARKMNAPYLDGYLYLNIVPLEGRFITGTIIDVSDGDLEALKVREEGSDLVEVTKNMTSGFGAPVYAFMQPDKYYPDMKVLQSYIDTCARVVPEAEREQWIKETIIENEIINDRKNPLYEFPA